MDYFNDVRFWALILSVALVSMQGQGQCIGFHQNIEIYVLKMNKGKSGFLNNVASAGTIWYQGYHCVGNT